MVIYFFIKNKLIVYLFFIFFFFQVKIFSDENIPLKIINNKPEQTITPLQAEKIFSKASHDYQNGFYPKAIKAYEKLISSEYGNGFVYFNLANSYFRQKKTGLAILNYQRAKFFLPRDAELDYNFRYVSRNIIDKIGTNENFFFIMFFWLDSLTFKESFWVFLFIHGILFLFLIIRSFIIKEHFFYVIIVVLILWLFGGISVLWKWHYLSTDSRTVVIEPEIKVHSGPDGRETLLFKLHEGAIVWVVQSEGEWSLINLPDKKRGWVLKKNIENILSPILRLN